MWCPEGYISLAEIADSVLVAADNRLWIKGTVPDIEPDPKPFLNIDVGPPYDECQAYGDWLMGRFLEQFANLIRVASPTGAVLRIAPGLLTVEVDDPFDYNDYRAFPDTREGRLRAGSVRPHWISFEGMRVNDQVSSGWELAVPSRTFALTSAVCHSSSRGRHCAG